MSPSTIRRRLLTSVAALSSAAALALVGTVAPAVAADLDDESLEMAVTVTTTPAPAPAPGAAKWGVYLGPGEDTADGATSFGNWSGLPISRTLEFAPSDGWTGHDGITEATWQLEAHRDSPHRLDYSIPLLPNDSSTSLATCATGAYNGHWARLGKNLVAYGQADAILRPGWEMNGSWYRWSAVGKTAQYVGCFRQLVTTMRNVPNQRFAFTWSPNIGSAPMKAETAYPGDAYVDVIGVSAYDYNWSWYPTPAGTSTATARAKAWAWTERGDHGLVFWRDFAKLHKKRLALPEWGLAARDDGHGGGDNPVYVGEMLDFITDPVNNVAYANYFNYDAPSNRHNLQTGRFPVATALLKSRALAIN